MATVHGYYRYTDIWFDWAGTIAETMPEDGQKVKALLAHDVLVHPNNPLHPGVAEIELFMGVLTNGESRLLFSDKQVDYVAYWLHAMGYTETRVPMPYSNCMLLPSELKAVSPVYYKTGGELKKGFQQIEKNNKKLRKGSGLTLALEARRVAFEKVRKLWLEKKGIWMAIDFEGWEYEHDLITELGISALRWDDGVEVIEDKHYMLSADRYRNGKWVNDNRTNYAYGESTVIKMKDFGAAITSELDGFRKHGAVFLVFHDASQDVRYLHQLEAPVKDISVILPDSVPAQGLFVTDTSDLFAALLGEESNNRRGLEQMCHHLQVKTKFLHNAGNDAHCTLEALKAMASGKTVDVQREERWPEHTGKRGGVQVEFTAEEEELSDDEDLYYS